MTKSLDKSIRKKSYIDIRKWSKVLQTKALANYYTVLEE